MSKFDRLLEAGSTELPDCRCTAEMHLISVVPAGGISEIRIFRCPDCNHELRLTAWRSDVSVAWNIVNILVSSGPVRFYRRAWLHRLLRQSSPASHFPWRFGVFDWLDDPQPGAGTLTQRHELLIGMAA